MPSLETAKSAEKTFDAVELTRRLRSEVHKETEHLSRTELKEYLRTHVEMPRYVSGRSLHRWESGTIYTGAGSGKIHE
uniref:Uncharacterized protein n=1 Tax=Candidatus Kentrum sp. FW TaxID=2126338 RepID=A0A450TPE7_9GAMM|nr:MAG: hypothetical protein BECKFW1821C_GA0114237_102010 [Candidatus Kentron sp. FW]